MLDGGGDDGHFTLPDDAPEDATVVVAAHGAVSEPVARAMAVGALAAAHPGARLLICGSLYLAGEVLGASEETWPV